MLKHRYHDALLDKHNLFNKYKSISKPHRSHGSWEGHEQQYEQERKKLKKWAKKYNDCDDKSDNFPDSLKEEVEDWKMRPFPSQPGEFKKEIPKPALNWFEEKVRESTKVEVKEYSVEDKIIFVLISITGLAATICLRAVTVPLTLLNLIFKFDGQYEQYDPYGRKQSLKFVAFTGKQWHRPVRQDQEIELRLLHLGYEILKGISELKLSEPSRKRLQKIITNEKFLENVKNAGKVRI